MSFLTTPLQFGYFMAWLFGILFIWRGYKEERLSDKLLGLLLFILALDIQDYTFGFSGINILWTELKGFPRGVALLTGPFLYFYIRSQVNTNFKLEWKHALHLVPWLIPFIIQLSIFLQGLDAVNSFEESSIAQVLNKIYLLARYASYIAYFYLSLVLYKGYKTWVAKNTSFAEVIGFEWFRNVIIGFILGYAFKEGMHALDGIYQWDFDQDWYWNLALVAIILYICIKGYTQPQPKLLEFEIDGFKEKTNDNKEWSEEMSRNLESVMDRERPYLKPDLTLRDLAKQTSIPSQTLSQLIRNKHQKNFNEFINMHRLTFFCKLAKDPNNSHYTLLALGLECGFNSKSTFNRVFKNSFQMTPSEWVKKNQD